MIVFYSVPTVKPTALSILAKPSHVSAERQLEVICQAVGGFPPPKLSWWLGAKKIRPHDEVSGKTFLHEVYIVGSNYVY